ncbi:sensor domain-containing diguanylate cyclase [Rubrobacter aplysinae]|uniref:sensor domain-containing diguanylate cyclase n=1 Tax=Rubrobacter aplysinae TaxID=909625 RepID=UPI00064C345B|nr:sensor domain-containing diguanylate cyclase [Rubrobacter aplysinae]
MELANDGGDGGDLPLSVHARYGSEMITIMEPWGVPRYESPNIDRVLGYRPIDDFEGGPEGGKWTEMIHPDDVEKMSESVKRSISEPGEHPPVEYRIKDAEGRWRWFESRGVNLTDDPEVAGIVVSTHEITERKQTECALAESERRLRALTEGAPVIMFAFDTEGVITFDAGSRLSALGLSPGSTVGVSVFELYEDRPRVLGHMRRALAGYEVVDIVDIEGPSGTLFFDTRYSPQWNSAGEVEGVVGVATDVTERKRLEDELAYRATHDSLTGLPNRALFQDRLQHALERSRREAWPLAVLLLDLDGFKSVNDSWGHDAGDELLVAASRRLEGLLRPSDTVCRLGGDEFALLLEGTGEEGACTVAQRITEEFAKPFRFPESGLEASVTVSLGIAQQDSSETGDAPPDEPSEKPDPHYSSGWTKSLLRRADRAMYEAKAQGKAGYRVA